MLASGCWRLDDGHRMMAAGCWIPDDGVWMMESGHTAGHRSWGVEAGSHCQALSLSRQASLGSKPSIVRAQTLSLSSTVLCARSLAHDITLSATRARTHSLSRARHGACAHTHTHALSLSHTRVRRTLIARRHHT